jgi:hypothetical protein
MEQINQDIKSRREGKIPSPSFTGKIFRKLRRNKFVVYIKGLPCEMGTERIMTEEEMKSNFVFYRPQEIQNAMKLKNQRKIDDYG